MIKKSTGKSITKLEATFLTQLNGIINDPFSFKLNTMQRKRLTKTHGMLMNMYLAILGERYGYEYKDHEINGITGEIIHVCKDCDEELNPDDIEIEEV